MFIYRQSCSRLRPKNSVRRVGAYALNIVIKWMKHHSTCLATEIGNTSLLDNDPKVLLNLEKSIVKLNE